MPTHARMIWSVFKRNFVAYFINPTGYVFITVFILLGAIAAFWQPDFFLNNLANLDQLNEYYPLLLLFFVPALTMNVWSEERRQGTDELLFTLPGRDVDIVLGKYLAVLGIFSVAVLFSLSHVVILMWLGEPDLGLMSATYLGYWLSGAALLSVGMVASLLTANATVAFILGALFCAGFVFVDQADAVLGGWASDVIRNLGIRPHFEKFGDGLVSASAVLYFVALTGVMLYLNVALLGRRHVKGGEESVSHGAHVTVRTLALAVASVSLVVLIERAGWFADTTAERLHTLQPQTRELIRSLPDGRPIYIQAFFSRSVPESYVQTRKNLLNLLNRFDDIGGDRIEVALHETEPFTETATLAAENYNITPQKVLAAEGSQRTLQDVFLGLVFTSGPEEFVIRFFDRGLPVEYELARSIRVVSLSERKKLGIVATNANLFGGFDFQTMTSRPNWSIIEELQKQYDVERVAPAGPYPDDLDALLAVLPSSMTQEELDALEGAILTGTPALIFDDPLPMFNPNLSPTLPSEAGRNPFAQNQPPPQPKGDFAAFLNSIGLTWRPESIVWDSFNPHPTIADVEPEVVFVARSPTNEQPFNTNSIISDGLQEVVMLFPGFVQPGRSSPATLSHTPLLATGRLSGTTDWNSLLTRSFFGMQMNPNPRRVRTNQDYTLAMRVTGTIGNASSATPPASASAENESQSHGSQIEDENDGKDENSQSESGDENETDAQDSATTDEEPSRIDVIMVADIDLISETFFDLRRRGFEGFDFDNVTFALNCIDVLAGDESFVALRKHRPRHRILDRLEELSRGYEEERRAETEAAEQQAAEQLAQAQQRLDEKVRELREREDIDEQTKAIMLRNLENVERRRLERIRAGIELEKEQQIARSRAEMETAVAGIQRDIKWWAAGIPPVPPLILAVALFAYRYKRERIGASERRLVESKK